MRKFAIPVAFAILVSIVLFFPYFTQGKVPLPIDIPVGTYFPWLAESFGYPVHPPVKNPILTDTVSQFWIWRNWAIEGLKLGDIRIWNPYSLSGYPLSPWFHTILFSPLNLFYFVMPQIDAMSMIVIAQITISLVGAYILGQKWYKTTVSALTVSILWTLSTYFVGWLTWGTVSFGLAILPYVILSTEMLFVPKTKMLGALGLIVTTSSLILSGHPQTILYMFGIVFIYALLTIRNTKKYKITYLFLACIVASMLIVTPVILPSIQIVSNSIRFEDTFLVENNFGLIPWGKLLTTIISVNFFGNPATYNYWGGLPNFQESLVNFGLLGFILSLIGLLLTIRTKEKDARDKFLIICFIAGFLLTTQFPIGFLPYKFYIPLLSTIPAGRGFIVTIFAGSLLAGKTVSIWQKKSVSKETLQVVIATVVLFVVLATYFVANESSHAKVAFRNSFLSLSILALGSLFLLAGSRLSSLKRYFGVFVVSLLFIEGYLFFIKYTPFVEKRLYFPQTKTTQFLTQKQKESEDFFRIDREAAEVLPANMWHQYGLHSSSGYDPIYPLIYSKYLISRGAQGIPQRVVDLGNANLYTNPELGVKYLLILKRKEDRKIDPNGEIPAWIDEEIWKEVFVEEAVVVLENMQFTPPYFFEKPELSRITLKEKKDNYWKFEVDTPTENRFVLMETTDPSWKAYINGVESEIIIYENTFKSVKTEPGKHNLEFVYQNQYLPSLTLFSWGSSKKTTGLAE